MPYDRCAESITGTPSQLTTDEIATADMETVQLTPSAICATLLLLEEGDGDLFGDLFMLSELAVGVPQLRRKCATGPNVVMKQALRSLSAFLHTRLLRD